MNYLISLAKDIVKKRRLIGELAKADFKKRFVGSYFGIVWMFIHLLFCVWRRFPKRRPHRRGSLRVVAGSRHCAVVLLQ